LSTLRVAKIPSVRTLAFERMETEKNTRLYWSWFVMWIGLTIVTYAISDVLLPILGKMEEKYETLLTVAICTASVPAMAIYGFFMQYFPGFRYNEIQRGTHAIKWNLFLMGVYVAIVIYAGIHFQKE